MNIDREFLEALRKWMYAPRCYTPNPERLALLEQTQNEFLQMMQEEHIRGELTIEQSELPLGDTFVFVEVNDLIVRDTARLAKLLTRFKNIELFSLPDGRIHFGARFANVYNVEIIKED